MTRNRTRSRFVDAEQKQTFIRSYAATGSVATAAIAVGFTRAEACGALGDPRLRDSIRRTTMAMLENEVVPMAASRHAALLADPETRGPTLTKAIELAYKHGLADRGDEDDRPLSELTAEELNARAERGRALVEALEREAADRARPIAKPSGGVFD